MNKGNNDTTLAKKKADLVKKKKSEKHDSYVQELLDGSKEAYEGTVEDDLLYMYTLVKAGVRDEKITKDLAKIMIEVLAKAQFKLNS